MARPNAPSRELTREHGLIERIIHEHHRQIIDLDSEASSEPIDSLLCLSDFENERGILQVDTGRNARTNQCWIALDYDRSAALRDSTLWVILKKETFENVRLDNQKSSMAVGCLLRNGGR